MVPALPAAGAAGVPGRVIRGAEGGSFAWGVLAHRHPALIDQVRRAHPYGPGQVARLEALRAEITGGVLSPLPAGAHDQATWDAWAAAGPDGGSCLGRSWFDVPFLWAESYFYRRLLEAVDFYAGPSTGTAWAGVDPFGPVKAAELAGLDLLAVPTDRQELLLASVTGNRADLGFRAGPGAGAHAASMAHDLVVDDSALLWQLLERRGGDAGVGRADGIGRADGARPGPVVVVADNAGAELLADLLLIDHLLAGGTVEQVVLHVKPAPYFVSDATGADVSAGLHALATAGDAGAAVAARLHAAAEVGALAVATHPFYCAPFSFHHVPPDLAAHFSTARLVVFKGDLNYRRLVGDRRHDATTDFAAVTRYLPVPVACLRTLKSDVVVGLDAATHAGLEASGHPWRTSGTHALIQARA